MVPEFMNIIWGYIPLNIWKLDPDTVIFIFLEFPKVMLYWGIMKN